MLRAATTFAASLAASLLLATTATAGAAGAPGTTPAKDTRLVEAVKSGNSAAAQALLLKKVNPNTPEADGTTPLQWATRNNDLTLMERLLRAGANPQTANRFGVTAIQLACQNGSAEAVSRLLKAGVSANATGEYGETALMTCARTGVVAAAKVLIEAGASVDAVESWRGQTALMWAAAEGHADMVKALIAAGADKDARSTIVTWERQRTQEPRDKFLPPGGLTPLLLAARQGRVDAARALLDAGADIDLVDPDRHTPLIMALSNGHVDVAKLLIERGADVNMTDKVGQTALWAAVDLHTVPMSNRPAPREFDENETSLDIIKMLLARNASVDAALRQQIPYRTKLDRGGDGVLGNGTTPLLRAAKSADTAVIKLLIEKGANPKAATTAGINALQMAANVGAKEEDMTGRNKTQQDIIATTQVLLAAGLDVNSTDSQGRAAAHGAAMWGLTDVVKFLHEKGAKLDLKDRKGLTPLDAALGKEGGFGFDGKSGVVREETARAIAEILGPEAAAAATAKDAPPPTSDPARQRQLNGETDPAN
jgi:ankyrin repeat protein